jgi:hypothetical protein
MMAILRDSASKKYGLVWSMTTWFPNRSPMIAKCIFRRAHFCLAYLYRR